MARSRVLKPSPIGLIGGVLAIISCFLAWGGYDDSFDVPLQFLWDKDATGGVKLGIPLVSVAAVVALFSVSAIEPFVSCGDSGVWCCSWPRRCSSSNWGDVSTGTSFRAATSRSAPTSPAPEASSRFSPPPDYGRSHAVDRDGRRAK
jgi:hypothetical protein